MRPVTGTGIKQTSGGVAEGGEQGETREAEAVTQKWPEQQSGDQPTDGDKDQRMTEMAMETGIIK